MAVPAEAPCHVVAAHGLVARDDVLDRAGQEVTVVRQARRERRAIIKHVLRTALAQFKRSLERPVLIPEGQDILFHPAQVHFIGYRFKHGHSPLIPPPPFTGQKSVGYGI